MSTASLSFAQPDDEREYVGARECSFCHTDVARTHADSPHALALQEAEEDEPELILADFSQGEDVRTVQFPEERTPRPFVAEDIAYVLGAGRYLQAYLYEVGDDQYAVFPAEWNTQTQSWERYELGESWPDDPAYDFGTNCAYCHVTGLSGLDDDEPGVEWLDDGVQCEACHGPGLAHVDIAYDAGRDPTTEDIDAMRAAIADGTDPQTCGQCHSQGRSVDDAHPFPIGYYPGEDLSEVFNLVAPDDPDFWWPTGHASGINMQYNEWLGGAHANALSALEGIDAANDSCLGCHSSDYQSTQARIAEHEAEALELEDDEAQGSPPTPLTLETAQYGVTCIGCHNPHAAPVATNGDEDEEGRIPDFYLETSTYELCTACHSDPDLTDHIHYPNQQMFEGVAVVDEVEGIPSSHFALEDGPDCASCHMPRVPVHSFNAASHTMQIVNPAEAADIEALDDSCSSCHGEQAAPAAMGALIGDIQAGTTLRLEAIAERLSEDSPEWMARAYAFVEQDSSLGVHNYAYVDALLTALENELDNLESASGGE